MDTNPFSPPKEPGDTSGYRPLGIFTGVLVTALALDAILLVSNNATTFALAARDPGAVTGNDPKDALSALLAFLAFLGAVLYLLSYFTGVLFFLLWLARANRNAHALGAEDMEFTPGWIVGWFFVPVFSLFKPYEAMRELYLASDPESGPDEWAVSEAPRFILLWWLSWIGFSLSGGVVGLVGGPALGSLLPLALGCIASGLAITVVLSIHRRQRERLARGALVSAATAHGPRHRFL